MLPAKLIFESLPYSGNAADAVVVRAAGFVGVAVRFEPLDDVNHLSDVARRLRRDFGALSAERVEVVEEGFDVLGRVLVNRLALLAREFDDAVFDVRDVHHVRDFVAAVLQVAAQHVAEGGHRSEVADVRVVPDRGAADVEPRLAFVHRAKLFELTGESVVELEHLAWVTTVDVLRVRV